MKTKTISINEILPGMKAFGDVYNELGFLIFNSGFVLKRSSITKLALYGVKSIIVEIPDDMDYDSIDIKHIHKESEYNKKVKSNPNFNNFVKVYEKNQQEVTNSINAVSNGEIRATNNFISITDDVYKTFKTNSELFSFLENIPIDDVTYTHSLNVSIIAKAFGKWLNLESKMINDLGIAGLLHDIGKTQIPKSILDKPGKLTPEEYEEIKKHPIYSYQLASKQNLNDNILKGILMHHERYDGSGYPEGIKGEQINLFARILAIADVFEAMTATRAYRSKICPFKVFSILESESYINFDPSIIHKILDNMACSYLGATVKLNTGQDAKIIFINKNVSRPIVEINGSIFDLSMEDKKEIYIEEMT